MRGFVGLCALLLAFLTATVALVLTLSRALPVQQVLMAVRVESNTDLFLVDVQRGFRHNLTVGDLTRDYQPSWSPDGERIVYVTGHNFETAVAVVDADGGSKRLLTDSAVFNRGPVWSPDGAWLVFVRQTPDSAEIFRLALNGEREHYVDARVSALYPAWSPDGERLAFLSDYEGVGLYIAGNDGAVQQMFSERVVFDWSPDGTQIAFSTEYESDNPYRIYVMDMATGDAMERSPGTGVFRFPTWSPNGEQLAFWSNHEGDYNLHVMNADGSEVRALLPTGQSWLGATRTRMSWSPDGTRLAFSMAQEDVSTLYIVRVDGSGMKTIATGGMSANAAPAWRPNGL